MKVLYILGSARCGSTVLSNVLGEVPGVFSAGEVRFLWDRAAQGRECGCGMPVAECAVWSSALDASQRATMKGGPTSGDPTSWQHEAVKVRHTWSILRDDAPVGALGGYLGAMEAVLRDVASSQGADVIVDASKRPSNGAALTRMREIEPYFLHLVRDPRAVAYSRSRPKPGRGGGLSERSMRDSVLHWSATNVASDAVRRWTSDRSLLLRYEDLVRDPLTAVSQILGLLDLTVEPPVDREGTVELHGNHNVSGNPDRFVTGSVTLRADDRWVSGLPAWARRFVTASTAPLLHRYGYPVRGPAATGTRVAAT